MNETTPRPRWITATVAGLLVMIVWTMVIKYVAPIHWLWAERLAGRPAAAPVMWDFWPLAHALLAALLWTRHRWAFAAGVAIAATEAAVVAVKLAAYAGAPDLSFWKLLWLSNKIYVLAFFACLLYVMLGPGRRDLRAARVQETMR
jgi:hypothetical protein